MTTLLVILWALLIALLLALLALRPRRTTRSRYELNRLQDEGQLRRERLLGNIFALRRTVILLVVAMASMLAITISGGWAVIGMTLTLLMVILIARIQLVARAVNRFYVEREALLLRFIERTPWLGILMLPGDHVPRDQRLESTQQLLHLITSSSLLSDEQQTIVEHGLTWHETTVKSIMVPRERIVSVKKTELLGPLVLDDLHKTGHNQFPVTHRSLDAIVGVLDITDSLEVTSAKSSQRAEDVMSTRVIHVSAQDTLPQALALLQKSKQHMLIVTGTDGATVGLATLADITRSLLGETGVK
jgi:CBS domain containing-hemolysin-like protein